MLSKKRKYVGIDFETTWLDLHKDVPIQIGIVEMDHDGNFLREYSSFIYPEKDIAELKNIVGFLTGISMDELQSAPKIQDIQDEVESYFDENTFVIGHNVDFDIHFLKKYFPNVQIYGWLDTYLWSQKLVHFAPSYALEVLVEYLYEKDASFTKIAQNYDLSVTSKEDKFHDALYDTKNALAMFRYFVQRINELQKNYPDLKYFLKWADTIFSKIFFEEESNTNAETDVLLSFPTLERALPGNAQLTSDTPFDMDNYTQRERYFVWNIAFTELLKKLATSKQQIILAFSHKQKLDIAKRYLQSIGVKNVGFIRWDQTFNANVFDKFLNKKVFSEDEIWFIIKYVSHVYAWMGFLDLNTSWDYQVYYLLKQNKDAKKSPLVLTTHPGLYGLMQDKDHTYRDHDVCFFDVERWHKNYNMFVSRVCDLYYTLNFIDTLCYVYKVRNQIKWWKYTEVVKLLEEYRQAFSIFMGVFFTEAKMLFVNTDANSAQSNPVQDNTIYYKTNKVWNRLMQQTKNFEEQLLAYDHKQLCEHIDHIDYLFSTLITVNKKMHGSWEFYFVFKEAIQYTNRDEFTSYFDKQKILFFSDFSKQNIWLVPQTDSDNQLPLFLRVHKQDKVIEFVKRYLQEWDEHQEKSCFVLSSIKHHSKQIFEQFCTMEFHKNALLLAENITWGVGKSVYKSKQHPRKVLIWSYNFLMWLYANGVSIDKVLVFNIRWAQEQVMLSDLKRSGQAI